MPAQPDPLSNVRRENFRDYCRRKGWQHPNGRWMVTSISQAIGKPTNKVSDLLNGNGSFGAAIARQIESHVNDLRPGELDGLDSPETESEEFTEVKHVNVRFANGHGKVSYEEDDKPPLAFRTDFLRKLGIKAGNAVVVEADGISNEPKITDGSVVLVNKGDTEHLRGDFFAFRVHNKLLIKRLERLAGIGILATAENSNFKPKTKVYAGSDLDDFEIIGRAVWTGSLL
ncbi:S24 family peptidase [Comamonas thiooxydans]|uniref:S24 family peptidase n=1 Tax=Comamonas thiooxydans TaxID=363952 RepID=UPI000B407215|nr:S24 family peptidase [Comamonas thiooxydans]